MAHHGDNTRQREIELIKIIRTAFEDEASKCQVDGFSNLVEKIESLLYEQTLDKNNESWEEAKKKKQELIELETQYEQLSKAQEELKQKMQLLELTHKELDLIDKSPAKPEAKASTSSDLSSLNTSIFRREFKIQGQIGERGQKDKLTYQSPNPQAKNVGRNDTMFRPRASHPRQCKSCFESNQVQCSHCFKCGELNHTAGYCRSGNGQRLPPGDRE